MIQIIPSFEESMRNIKSDSALDKKIAGAIYTELKMIADKLWNHDCHNQPDDGCQACIESAERLIDLREIIGDLNLSSKAKKDLFDEIIAISSDNGFII